MLRPNRLISAVLCLELCLVIEPLGFAQEIRFEPVTVTDGLSNNNIYAILQDSKGYLWIGTQEGLNRYDGYSMKVYRPDPGAPQSISGDWIRTLHEGRDGTIWVGTDRDGLNRFDPQTETFTSYRHSPGDSAGIIFDGAITAIQEDQNGMIWIGSELSGLYRFDPRTETFSRYQYPEQDPTSLGLDLVRVITISEDGTLWIGTASGGLMHLDPWTDSFTLYRHQADDPYSLNAADITALAEERDGILWIGTGDGGLKRFDNRTQSFTSYRYREENPASLRNKEIRALAIGKDGVLWIGTSDGLISFDSQADIFTSYRHRADDPNSLSADEISALYTAPDGSLWIGTGGYGLNRATRVTKSFASYPFRKGMVLAIVEASPDTLLIGTYDGGLNRFNTSSGTFETYYPVTRDSTDLRADRIQALHKSADGTLWAGTLKDGLIRIDPKTGFSTSYRHRPDDPTSLSSDWIWSIQEGIHGTLWLGTWNGGLNHFDPSTGIFTSYRHRAGDSTSLTDNDIWALYEELDGRLWVGTEGGGLNYFDPETVTFTAYQYEADNPTSLSHNRVNVLYKARDGALWIGTSNGLNRLLGDPEVPSSVSFERFTVDTSNFNGSGVFSILEDDRGMLWLGLSNGTLARFSPGTGHFRFFGFREGVEIKGFEAAALYTHDGIMYLGGNGGVIAFDPMSIKENTEPPRVYLTELRLFNDVVHPGLDSPLKNPLSETKGVVFKHIQNDVSIGFVGIYLPDPEGTRYNYRLTPYDRDWRGVTDERRATYTSLPPGQYRFEVVAANSDGYWTRQPVTLGVVIRFPWWRTRWAYVCYVLIFIGVVFAAERFQRLRLIQRERRRAQERELEQARQIEKAHIELQESHEHLKAMQAQLIHQEKMASLGQLTAGIAHEIKNPLNFVNNFADLSEGLTSEILDEIKANPGMPAKEIEETITDLKLNAACIAKHGKRADRIVQSMMQHSISGGERYEVDLNPLVEEFISLTYTSLQSQNPDLEVRIEKDLARSVGLLIIMPHEFGRVLQNILVNALEAVYEKKQTMRGTYEPKISVVTRREFGRVEIRIADNGPGIPQHAQDKIFEPFYTTKPTGSGTGLGLSLSYDIVTQGHGGRLEVESVEGEGATFVITLPEQGT